MPLTAQLITGEDFKGRAKVFLDGTQSISSGGSHTDVEYTDVQYDDSSYWNATSHQFEIPAGMGGLYRVKGLVSFSSNSTGRRTLRILQDGNLVAAETNVNANQSSFTRIGVQLEEIFQAGTLIGAQVFQNSGGSLNINGTSSSITSLSISRIQP